MSEYGEFALNLAQQASKLIARGFQLGAPRTIKADGSPVTETDIAVNRLVVDALHTAYPDHSLLGEEESRTVEGAEWTWVCDPLDGTVPFTNGMPFSTFALSLTHNGEAVIGVIADPYTDRIFFAEKGQGATLNGKPLTTSDALNLQDQVVIFECPAYRPEVDASVRSALGRAGATVLTIRSALYCCGLVAAGALAGVIYLAKSPWDAAPAAVIIKEAGGTFTDVAGNAQRYDGPINGYVASNGPLHQQILECLGPVDVIGD